MGAVELTAKAVVVARPTADGPRNGASLAPCAGQPDLWWVRRAPGVEAAHAGERGLFSRRRPGPARLAPRARGVSAAPLAGRAACRFGPPGPSPPPSRLR